LKLRSRGFEGNTLRNIVTSCEFKIHSSAAIYSCLERELQLADW